MNIIRCPQCGNILAVRRATGSWELKRKGRAVVFRGMIEELTCEECRTTWQPETSEIADLMITK